MKRIKIIIPAVTVVMALGAWASGEIPQDVVALFKKNCAGCHKGAFAPKGLSLQAGHIADAIDAPSKEVPSLKIIDTKTPGSSYMLKKIRRDKDIAGKPMPPGKALAADELQVFEAWIQGLKKLPVL